jgi:hypothetical protein
VKAEKEPSSIFSKELDREKGRSKYWQGAVPAVLESLSSSSGSRDRDRSRQADAHISLSSVKEKGYQFLQYYL